MKPLLIAGGGLAGLTLGIALRRDGVPVTVFEASSYPRHRVCGEFINGRGLGVLEGLGLLEDILASGAQTATHAAFFFGGRGTGPRGLPRPAVCISRHDLDALLAETFRRGGGELRQNCPWKEEPPAEGFVLASGRRRVASDGGWRWFGLKAHLTGVELQADLEMHRGKHGYVGLCRLGKGRVNVCGLFRRRPGAGGPGRPKEWLRGEPGTALQDRMANAQLDEQSLCSVGGLELRPRRAAEQSQCRIGDALTMIAPLTGNGMSMAFEAAALATGPLTEYSRGDLDWVSAQRAVATRCDAAFGRRLRCAAWLQELILGSLGGSAFAPLLLAGPGWPVSFRMTR